MAVVLLLVSPASQALDKARMDAAVKAHLALFSTDDIVEERFAQRASAVDLDGDGVEEILFMATARCVGANFDCPNELVVLAATAGAPGQAGKRLEPDVLAAAQTGYGLAGSEQIPGEVQAVRVLKGTIEIAFLAQQDSPVCKRSFSTDQGRQATTHCPAPGRHTWTYRWSRGKLTKVSS
ncbi:hypothetical protein LA76x_3102 [Lysobacter antibioticus]|uniref:Uncharacterized protein n=2 Tax=Lysobacter antibioticus TaxID=84531 RepID=A0A0S2FCG3_LYSAN|nr:hypothetical protein LA76x_3102 [Lysobacter antibioticus]